MHISEQIKGIELANKEFVFSITCKDLEELKEIEKWCSDNIGVFSTSLLKNPYSINKIQALIGFANKNDAAFFSLVWRG